MTDDITMPDGLWYDDGRSGGRGPRIDVPGGAVPESGRTTFTHSLGDTPIALMQRRKSSHRASRRACDAGAPLPSGASFAGYRVLQLLGSGGMGEVYLAAHPRLPRRDAVKILPRAMTVDGEFRERFHREADLAAVLWHPNIVAVHDRGEFDGQLWIAMDYVAGTDAGRLMQARHPAGMPIHEVCAIVSAVARALDHAHQRGLLHRDVKPANILLADPEDGERRTLLADFGIAQHRGDISGLTATNFTVGTVAYAAPEQLLGADIDGRADQYALAATAFHLLTGALPYQECNQAAVIGKHLTAAPPKLSAWRPELAHLDQVMSIALAKDPANRFPRCRDFAMALSERASGDVQRRRPAETGATVCGRNERPPAGRRRPQILVGAAIAVAALILGITGYLVEPKKHTAAIPATSTAAPATAVLDGSYRLDYELAKQTQNGAFDPPLDSSRLPAAWWAFRSVCTSTGCVATGTALDSTDRHLARTPAGTDILDFSDNRWQDSTPVRKQVSHQRCLAAQGTAAAGSDTEVSALSLQPQPDGTLRGVVTITVLTNECALQGTVVQVPLIAARVGDRPSGVSVADPAKAGVAPGASTQALAVAGPALDGTYRLDYDFASQTANGQPTNLNSSDDQTHWWAFHSRCTSTGCVTAGAALAAEDHQEATGGSVDVLYFSDGHWQDIPSLLPPQRCPGTTGTTGTAGATADTETFSWSFEPQPDGTLRGVATVTALTNECGNQGTVWQTPLVATRTGAVPPYAMVADPALFAAPTPHGKFSSRGVVWSK